MKKFLYILLVSDVFSKTCLDYKSIYQENLCCTDGFDYVTVNDSSTLTSQSLSHIRISQPVMGLSGDGKTAVLVRENLKIGDQASIVVESSIPFRSTNITIPFRPLSSRGYEGNGYYPSNFRKVTVSDDGSVFVLADSTHFITGSWFGRLYTYRFHDGKWHKSIDFSPMIPDACIGWEDAVTMNIDGSLITASVYDDGAKSGQESDGNIVKDIWAWKWNGTAYNDMPVGENNIKMANVVSMLPDGSEMFALDRYNKRVAIFKNTGASWKLEYQIDYTTNWPSSSSFTNVNYAKYAKNSAGERIISITNSGTASVYRFEPAELSKLSTPVYESLSGVVLFWQMMSADGRRIVFRTSDGFAIYDYISTTKKWKSILNMDVVNIRHTSINRDASMVFVTFTDNNYDTIDEPPKLFTIPQF